MTVQNSRMTMMQAPSTSERFRGCLLGLAAGDAVGTTLEFKSRGSFTPITDMVGGGPFGLLPGQWTDDTSMALCLGTSLAETGGFDPRDQMDRYCRWYEEGYLSSTGACFDIGTTVSKALRAYQGSGDPWSGSDNRWSAGNGCIMRLAPVPMYYHPDREQAVHYSMESSRTTHGARECLDACALFGEMLHRALGGAGRDEVLFSCGGEHIRSAGIKGIAAGEYRDRSVEDIRGTGYVVACLEAALWCFYTTGSFEDAILKSANLGDDADTTAAVCGQIAGAYYGERGIPAHWLEQLVMKDEIRVLADQLSSNGRSINTPVNKKP